MPEFYEHQKPNERVLYVAQVRLKEIKDRIEQLRVEEKTWKTIIKRFEPLVCPDCAGEGHVMKLIKGCECDGPRMHTCDTCGGSGKPPNSVLDRIDSV